MRNIRIAIGVVVGVAVMLVAASGVANGGGGGDRVRAFARNTADGMEFGLARYVGDKWVWITDIVSVPSSNSHWKSTEDAPPPKGATPTPRPTPTITWHADPPNVWRVFEWKCRNCQRWDECWEPRYTRQVKAQIREWRLVPSPQLGHTLMDARRQPWEWANLHIGGRVVPMSSRSADYAFDVSPGTNGKAILETPTGTYNVTIISAQFREFNIPANAQGPECGRSDA